MGRNAIWRFPIPFSVHITDKFGHQTSNRMCARLCESCGCSMIQNSSTSPLLCPSSNCLILSPWTSKNLLNPSAPYLASAEIIERLRKAGIVQDDNTKKVALSRVTLSDERQGNVRDGEASPSVEEWMNSSVCL